MKDKPAEVKKDREQRCRQKIHGSMLELKGEKVAESKEKKSRLIGRKGKVEGKGGRILKGLARPGSR